MKIPFIKHGQVSLAVVIPIGLTIVGLVAGAVSGYFGGVDAKVQPIANQTADLSVKVGKLETRVDAVDKRLDKLESIDNKLDRILEKLP